VFQSQKFNLKNNDNQNKKHQKTSVHPYLQSPQYHLFLLKTQSPKSPSTSFLQREQRGSSSTSSSSRSSRACSSCLFVSFLALGTGVSSRMRAVAALSAAARRVFSSFDSLLTKALTALTAFWSAAAGTPACMSAAATSGCAAGALSRWTTALSARSIRFFSSADSFFTYVAMCVAAAARCFSQCPLPPSRQWPGSCLRLLASWSCRSC